MSISYLNKNSLSRRKDIDCNITLPSMLEKGLAVEDIEKCTNIILQSLEENKLNVRDSIYTLRLCEEIILSISPTASKKIEVSALKENVSWFTEGDY